MNQFIQVRPDSIIIDRSDLTLYGIAAVAVVVVVAAIVIAIKFRRKNFIKTVPTNLKSGE